MKKYQLTYSKIKDNDILINNIITHYNFGKKYGLTQKEICKEFKISKYTLRKIFQESNRKIYSKRVYEKDIEEIVKQYKKGIPIYNEKNYFETIAGYHGLSKSTIIKYLKQQGVYNPKKEYKLKNKKNREAIIKKEKNLEEKIFCDNRIENKETTKYFLKYNTNNYSNFFNKLGRIAKKALITTTAGLILAGSIFFGGYKKGYYDAKMTYKEKEKINYVEKKENVRKEIQIIPTKEIKKQKIPSAVKKISLKEEPKIYEETKKEKQIYEPKEALTEKIIETKEELKKEEKIIEEPKKIEEKIESNIIEESKKEAEKENSSYKIEETKKVDKVEKSKENLERLLSTECKNIYQRKEKFKLSDLLFNIPEIYKISKHTRIVKYEHLREIANKGKEIFNDNEVINVYEFEDFVFYDLPNNLEGNCGFKGIWRIKKDFNGERYNTAYYIWNDPKTKNVNSEKPTKKINFSDFEQIIKDNEKKYCVVLFQHIPYNKKILDGIIIQKKFRKNVEGADLGDINLIIQNPVICENDKKLTKAVLIGIGEAAAVGIGISNPRGSELILPGRSGGEHILRTGGELILP